MNIQIRFAIRHYRVCIYQRQFICRILSIPAPAGRSAEAPNTSGDIHVPLGGTINGRVGCTRAACPIPASWELIVPRFQVFPTTITCAALGPVIAADHQAGRCLLQCGITFRPRPVPSHKAYTDPLYIFCLYYLPSGRKPCPEEMSLVLPGRIT